MYRQTTMPNATSLAARSVGHSQGFSQVPRTVYPRERRKSTGRKVFCDDGTRRVCVGTLEHGVFTKRVREHHILQKPRAIAIQASVLDELQAAGCRFVEAVLDDGRVLRAPIERFAAKGFCIDRGFGAQTALPLAQWDEECGQRTLFEGVST